MIAQFAAATLGDADLTHAVAAFYALCAAGLFAIGVVGVCWLVERCDRRIAITAPDDDLLTDAFLGDDAARRARAIQLGIEATFFRAVPASHVARAFSTGAYRLTSDDIERIWRKAQDEGRLPKLNRPDFAHTRGPAAPIWREVA